MIKKILLSILFHPQGKKYLFYLHWRPLWHIINYNLLKLILICRRQIIPIKTGSFNSWILRTLKLLWSYHHSKKHLQIVVNWVASDGILESLITEKDSKSNILRKLFSFVVAALFILTATEQYGCNSSSRPDSTKQTTVDSIPSTPGVTICNQVWMVKNLDVTSYKLRIALLII